MGLQDIAQFEFVDAQSRWQIAGPRVARTPGGSNVNPASTQIAPTVILLDALNTGTRHQIEIRRDMLMFLEKLPPDTPVAVFLLEHQLHVVQNFTTDPAILRAAVQKVVSPMTNQKYPQLDAESVSNSMQEFDSMTPAAVTQSLQDFETGVYQAMVQERVDETADAMRAIAKYLSGYPGRKDVIWFSEAFPIWIEPNTHFGSDPFFGSASYESKVQAAAASLMDAGVAVYPVDARGLETDNIYSAANATPASELSPTGFGAGLKQEDEMRLNSQAMMEQMADETGGRTCVNTNDLAGCVFHALNEDSSFYEISYYPTNVKWDNQLHKITIKTSVHGVNLDYRRGYVATDSSVLMKHENSADILKDACRDTLPSTAIGMTITALPSNPGQSAEVKYLLAISPRGLTLEPHGQSLGINVRMAICEFDPKGDKFAFYPRDLSRPVSSPVLSLWQRNGFRSIFDYAAHPADQRLRFAVVDLPSGEVGSVDVPAHPTEFGTLVKDKRVVLPASPAAPMAGPPVPQPAASAAAAAPHVVFRASGKTGSLDWSGKRLTYQGDLGAELTAPAFFGSIYNSKYHCEAGKLLSNDSNGGPPNLRFVFRSPLGLTASVDLSGEAPVYSGNLPVDSSAKAFFERLWKLCHCESQ